MTQLQTGWKRWAVVLVAYIGGSAHQLASAGSLDDAKLALLSCLPEAGAASGAQEAANWLTRSADVLPNDAGLHLAGPLTLGKACLKNVTVTGSFGVMMAQGEICNERLRDFTDALSRIGIVVGKITSQQGPEAVAGSVTDKGRYMITKGMIDMTSGKTLPTSAAYAFMCGVAGGGPQ